MTGGTGFLGYHLVRTLSDLTARIRVFALTPRADHPVLKLPGVEFVPGDVRDPAAVRTAVSDCSVVFHTAGFVATWGPAVAQMHAVHVEGTRHVLDAVSPRTRVVHTSSVVAIGAARTRTPLDESTSFNLSTIKIDYVHAKRAAEVVAFGADRDVVVVNPGYLLGPEDFERSVMGQICHRFWRGRIPLVPPGGLCLVDVRDVAHGHLLAAEYGQRGQRYILGGENLDYRAFFERLAAVAGMRPRFLPYIPYRVFQAAAAMNELRGRLRGKEPFPSLAQARLNRYYWFYSSDRARHDLGYVARPVSESLHDAHEWFAAREPFRVRGVNRWLLRPGNAHG